ncbi:hypothetical protein Dsin_009050 [Dipteronia sinensis]|uniref:Uncharacterized protein n=1 Tax=Dipteronia sinensis TaxID=43782 RepID=A0AAE0ED44_9ROSI|nr:hypothetical protein Dsin_009050 [Dipteronia sinensis]
MATLTDLKFVSTLLVFTIFHFESTLQTPSSAAAETYIIHMDISAMPKAFSGHHSWYMSMLSSSSKHIYTYTNSIHGFSAILTSSELESLKNSPGYVSSTRDHPLKVHTTHTPQFLGLSSSSGAWPASNYGEGVIIGLVDTGIWPESESFNDQGMTKVPSRWKGKCMCGNQFNSSSCNNKLIGARFYNKGLIASNPKLKISMNSPRDVSGHGTHTSSIAAGNYVEAASYFGYANGIARGMAPRAHVAMYKAIWTYGVYSSDVIAAIDQALQDGVDILSLSLGMSVKDIFLENDPIAIAIFAAMEKGIFVVASAGNDGPLYWTLINGAPWLLTVGSATTDREFEGTLTLGNQVQISFMSLYPGNSSSRQIPLVYMDGCGSVTELKKVKFNIIVCNADLSTISSQVENAVSAEAVGAVFISNSSISESEFYIRSSFPAAFTGLHDGQTIIDYIHKSSNPTGSLQFQKTVIDTKPAPKLDSYSSRGPFPSCPSILKPDLLAPGSLVLASWSPISPVAKVRPSRLLFSDFNLISGTSMATPHVAGVAALVKAVHADWSPAAIRSALVTTADSLDNTLGSIKDIANCDLPASPLEMGAGLINPNKALNPGLVYDATADDYVNFLCTMNYTTTQIRIITKSSSNCINRSIDLNYPSFIAFFNNVDSNPNEKVVQVFWRTVTNVGDQGRTIYTAKLQGMEGLKVSVEPEKLEFKQKYEKQSYKLALEGPNWLEKVVIFGSLTWVNDDGKYVVRSPIVATSLVPESP